MVGHSVSQIWHFISLSSSSQGCGKGRCCLVTLEKLSQDVCCFLQLTDIISHLEKPFDSQRRLKKSRKTIESPVIYGFPILKCQKQLAEFSFKRAKKHNEQHEDISRNILVPSWLLLLKHAYVSKVESQSQTLPQTSLFLAIRKNSCAILSKF